MATVTPNNVSVATAADMGNQRLMPNSSGQMDEASIIAAAVAGKSIVVRDIVITSAGTQTVALRNGASTAILGPYPMVAGVPLPLDWTNKNNPTDLSDCPKLTAGNALYAIASSTGVVAMTGHVFYV